MKVHELVLLLIAGTNGVSEEKDASPEMTEACSDLMYDGLLARALYDQDRRKLVPCPEGDVFVTSPKGDILINSVLRHAGQARQFLKKQED